MNIEVNTYIYIYIGSLMATSHHHGHVFVEKRSSDLVLLAREVWLEWVSAGDHLLSGDGGDLRKT